MSVSLSRRRRIILLLGALPMVRSALRSRSDQARNPSGPGSLVLIEEHPGFSLQDSAGNYVWPFHALEQALTDLRATDKRAHIQVWRVYCEQTKNPTALELCRAHIGLKKIEASPHLPSYIRVPQELLDSAPVRPSSHEAKKAQNAWIRELRAEEGKTHQEIANIVGVSRRRISQILGEAA